MQDIKLGDIIIFDGGDDWLGKAICSLTKSKVSHAAMVYKENEIVEMGSKGIAVSKIAVKSGTDAHLLRLSPEKPYQPLGDTAKKYVDASISYDYPALVFLAGLLIYRNIRPTPRWQKITDFVLSIACNSLDKLLDKIIHKGSKERAMVCSQLVYQIYMDCGKDYLIKISDGLLTNNMVTDEICLADLAMNMNSTPDLIAFDELNYDDIDIEEISKELFLSISESDELMFSSNEMLSSETVLHSATTQKAKKILDLLEQILKYSHIDIPVKSIFVTPADLYMYAENLDNICDFTLDRI